MACPSAYPSTYEGREEVGLVRFVRLRREHLWIVAILAVALGVRVALVLLTPHYRPVEDGGDYVRLGASLAHGHGYGISTFAPGPTAFRPPLYPFFLALVFKVAGGSITTTCGLHASNGACRLALIHISGHPITIVRLVQAVVGTASVGLVGVVGWQLRGRRLALIAMAIAAVLPSLVLAAEATMSESLFVPLLLGALGAGLQSRRSTRPVFWAGVAGLVCGLALLDRPNAVVLVLCVLCLVPVVLRRKGWRGLALPAAVVIAALAVVSPWTIRNLEQFHTLIPVTDSTGINLAGTYNQRSAAAPGALKGTWRLATAVPEYSSIFADQHLNEEQVSQRLEQRAVRYAVNHPAYVLEVFSLNTIRLFGGSRSWMHYSTMAIGLGGTAAVIWLVGWLVLVVAALGGIMTRAVRRWPIAFLIGPILFWVTSTQTAPEARYRMPIEIFCLFPAAALIEWAWGTVLVRRGSRAEPMPAPLVGSVTGGPLIPGHSEPGTLSEVAMGSTHAS